jgi:hypothetical protein
MNLNRLLLAVIASATFTTGLYFFAEPHSPAKLPVLGTSTLNTTYPVTHKIDFAGQRQPLVSTLSIQPTDTAYALLSRHFSTTSFTTSTGLEVESINNIKSQTTSQHWSLFINGEHITIPPDRFLLHPNDLVEWKITSLK